MAPGPGVCSRKWTRGWRRTQPTGPSRSSPSATHSISTLTTSAPACDAGATRTSPRSEGRPSAATRTGRGTRWWSTSRHRGASPERPDRRVAITNGSHPPERRRGSGGKEGSVVTSRALPHGEVRGTRDAGSSSVSGHRLGPDRPTRTAPHDVHPVRELPRPHGHAVQPLDPVVEQRSIAPWVSRILAGAHLLSGSPLLRLFRAAMAHWPRRQPFLVDQWQPGPGLQRRPADGLHVERLVRLLSVATLAHRVLARGMRRADPGDAADCGGPIGRPSIDGPLPDPDDAGLPGPLWPHGSGMAGLGKRPLDGRLLSHLLQHRPALWARRFGRPVRVRGPQTVPPARCHRPGSRRPVGRAARRANRHRPARCTRSGRAISPRVDDRGHQRTPGHVYEDAGYQPLPPAASRQKGSNPLSGYGRAGARRRRGLLRGASPSSPPVESLCAGGSSRLRTPLLWPSRPRLLAWHPPVYAVRAAQGLLSRLSVRPQFVAIRRIGAMLPGHVDRLRPCRLFRPGAAPP